MQAIFSVAETMRQVGNLKIIETGAMRRAEPVKQIIYAQLGALNLSIRIVHFVI